MRKPALVGIQDALIWINTLLDAKPGEAEDFICNNGETVEADLKDSLMQLKLYFGYDPDTEIE